MLNFISPFSVAPRFLHKPEDVSGEKGSDAILTCLVEGNPDPSYTWFRNGDFQTVCLIMSSFGSMNLRSSCFYKNMLYNICILLNWLFLWREGFYDWCWKEESIFSISVWQYLGVHARKREITFRPLMNDVREKLWNKLFRFPQKFRRLEKAWMLPPKNSQDIIKQDLKKNTIF